MAVTALFRHVGLVVHDMAGQAGFYQTVFGFSTISKADESGLFLDVILGGDGICVRTLKMGKGEQEMQLELLEFVSPASQEQNASPREFYHYGFTHLAFTVEDVETACALVTSHGGVCLSCPQLNDAGSALVVFCRDPEGNLLELVKKVNNI